MKFLFRKNFIFIFLFLFIGNISFSERRIPRISIVFVVDQFAYHYLTKLSPYLRGGIRFLLDNGVVYNNAYFPHAMPSTAVGHTALSTGVYAKDHGVIGNKWYDSSGGLVNFGDDNAADAAIFKKDGISVQEGMGRSAKLLCSPTVSDQFVSLPQAGAYNDVYAVSLKDRAAIAVAGSLGKAIWFDAKGGYFTSSRAYFDRLPDWLIDFNKAQRFDTLEYLFWKPAYPLKNEAYQFDDVTNYNFIVAKPLMKKKIKVVDRKSDTPYEMFERMPEANQVLLDLSEKIVDMHAKKNKTDRMLLWISLSPLDKLGHLFGDESIEILDMIYHLDKQLKRFIRRVKKKIRLKDVLFAFTADHGVEPIPELLQKKGMSSALRIDQNMLIDEMNKLVHKKYGISGLIVAFKFPQFFFDHKVFDNLDQTKRDAVVQDLKLFLKRQPGIKNAWGYDELQHATFSDHDIENFFKMQLYDGRSGYLTVQPFPFCQISVYKGGTSHTTPYEFNTHVPLMFYQKDEFEKKIVVDKVSMLQFANTLAEIIHVPKAPASTFTVLPGLFETTL